MHVRARQTTHSACMHTHTHMQTLILPLLLLTAASIERIASARARTSPTIFSQQRRSALNFVIERDLEKKKEKKKNQRSCLRLSAYTPRRNVELVARAISASSRAKLCGFVTSRKMRASSKKREREKRYDLRMMLKEKEGVDVSMVRMYVCICKLSLEITRRR